MAKADIARVKIAGFETSPERFLIIAGPCVIESYDILYKTASQMKELSKKLDFDFVFKSSFDKANRTSVNGFRGPGLERKG